MPTSVYNLRGSRSSQGTPKDSPLKASNKGSVCASPLKTSNKGSIRESPLKTSNKGSVRESPLKTSNKGSVRESPLKKPSTNVTPSKVKGTETLDQSQKSPLKSGSPLKRSPAKDSTTESPIKKLRKISALLEDMPQLPPELVNALAMTGNIASLDDLSGKEEGSLWQMVAPLLEKKEQSGLKKEMFTAWIRCLLARSKDPKTPLLWRDWVDVKVMAKSRSTDKMAAPSRSDLVKQRQSLKKSTGPVNRAITFGDLRKAKAKLTVLPVGKALKGKVEPTLLQTARQGLKKMTM
ncbi:hypothetical protein PSACC_00262 [Paramicrosporidium saccamoebae]|uniref:Uncharacterized protein n=1 Tax=Paramicrosporidium saccamoebae TaxID=1246581 RepID=A0A2H9TQB0_9FUNG|nr:hypothetical protein PSACC_00262 [Paramicrosporidium saccamoebae]